MALPHYFVGSFSRLRIARVTGNPHGPPSLWPSFWLALSSPRDGTDARYDLPAGSIREDDL
ncbi:MAG: hypothetical protein QF828_09620, partial [Pseudomonadales bacterium]|nr:hypothetical protein [Pseudomonadales bacterium]